MELNYFIGIDIGTQGARVVLADADGNVLGSEGEDFPLSNASREEQDPLVWWASCTESIKRLLSSLRHTIDIAQIKAVSVCSTSGTVIPIDHDAMPLHPAMMYSDGRPVAEAAFCKETASKYHPSGFTAFNASCGLPKMLWFLAHYPGKIPQLYKFIHAADFITGRLSGNYNITDYTNAFKSGYDIQQYEWPAYLVEHLPLKAGWLQEVAASGTVIGNIDPAVASQLGLPASVQVVAGVTDGCAAQVAAGAVKPGDWNTTIGTTLVIKGVTEKELIDPEGRIYSHRHPEGYWMPGGASNTGADWVTRDFGNENLELLNEEAAALVPTNLVAYPLKQQGERFPFKSPQARGFYPEGTEGALAFAAGMEGVAFLEKYAYDLIDALSGERPKAIYTAGGASNSDLWLKIRASVLNLPIYKMKYVTGAMGAAIMAAAHTYYHSVTDAASHMVKTEKIVNPDKKWAEAYRVLYLRFINTLHEKGFI